MRFIRSVTLGLVLPALFVVGCSENEPTEPMSVASKSKMPGTMIYGVTADNALISFTSSAPNKVIDEVEITGLMSGEKITGIDFRPSDLTSDGIDKIGMLYGISNQSRMYVIDPETGMASSGTQLSVAVTGTVGGVGFNPVPDRIRIHGTDGQNLRVNPETGATITDVALAYMSGDVNFGDAPKIGSLSYTNSDNDATTGTALYAIDSDNDVLVILTNPNAGLLSTVGSLGVDTDNASGFDIVGTSGGTAYATLSTSASGKSTLYSINLATGQATSIGKISQSHSPVVSIAVAP